MSMPSYDRTHEYTTLALFPPLLIDAIPLVGLNAPRHLSLLGSKQPLFLCEAKNQNWLKIEENLFAEKD
jgi:hypothetical protein